MYYRISAALLAELNRAGLTTRRHLMHADNSHRAERHTSYHFAIKHEVCVPAALPASKRD